MQAPRGVRAWRAEARQPGALDWPNVWPIHARGRLPPRPSTAAECFTRSPEAVRRSAACGQRTRRECFQAQMRLTDSQAPAQRTACEYHAPGYTQLQARGAPQAGERSSAEPRTLFSEEQWRHLGLPLSLRRLACAHGPPTTGLPEAARVAGDLSAFFERSGGGWSLSSETRRGDERCWPPIY